VTARLHHPSSLGQWQAWQARQHPTRRVVAALRSRRHPQPPPVAALALPEPEAPHATAGRPRVLVALDALSPSHRAAVLDPVDHLPPAEVAVLAPTGSPLREPGPAAPLTGDAATRHTGTVAELLRRPELADLRLVVVAGHHLPLGAAAHALAAQRGLPTVVVQHGLLTPHAPPLPPGARLLAWTDADAGFWRSGRSDVAVETVGSQLLWRAARSPLRAPDPDAPPIYLGQLHGAELARASLAYAGYSFCRRHDATYRPHPSERDKISRALHAAWRRAGIRVDDSGRPLGDPPAPVVSVFSTGVLEAAARGLPGYVDHPHPPVWLRDFWERYAMSRWGQRPTPVPDLPATAPAAAVAAYLLEIAGGPR